MVRDRRVYELSGGARDALALDDGGIEQRVEGKWHSCRLPPGALKDLMRRSDRAGLANFAPWMLLLAASGVVVPLCGGMSNTPPALRS